jgi:argininosuccinate lyase
MKVQKLWGERLRKEMPQHVIDFLSGRDVRGVPPCDEVLIPYDIWGSKAHAIMLWRQGIISEQDSREILKGLKEVETLYSRGSFRLDVSKEDVHSNIESHLIEHFGMESVGKMHTGRSRNDQIALDMRLYLRDQAGRFIDDLTALLQTMATRARRHVRTVMPGFTHHQHAMITTFGHMLLGLAIPLERDLLRFVHWYGLFNRNPLGGAAGYGTAFPVDRQLTSRFLGFDSPHDHSTDPITNRWEPETDLAFAISMTMNHLSAIAQTLILLGTTEFEMIRLDDVHSSGSSVMPQKRNPDPLEVIKAKASVAQGALTGLISIGRAPMVGYNRESQWTKYMIMDLVSECAPAVPMMREIIELVEVNEGAMEAEAHKGFIAATHLLESLVKQSNLPFRQAKVLVEKAVRFADEGGRGQLDLADLNHAVREMGLHLTFRERDIAEWQDPMKILGGESGFGGPAPSVTRKTVSSLRRRLRGYLRWRENQLGRIRDARKEIESIEQGLGIE